MTSEDSSSDPPRLILIFFIGGCTYAEISALRFLSQQEDCKKIFNYFCYLLIIFYCPL